MLALVPHVHWIVVEDANENSKLVTDLLLQSNLIDYTHISVKTPDVEKIKRWVSNILKLYLRIRK